VGDTQSSRDCGEDGKFVAVDVYHDIV
jgi:hypothetical protein